MSNVIILCGGQYSLAGEYCPPLRSIQYGASTHTTASKSQQRIIISSVTYNTKTHITSEAANFADHAIKRWGYRAAIAVYIYARSICSVSSASALMQQLQHTFHRHSSYFIGGRVPPYWNVGAIAPPTPLCRRLWLHLKL